MGNKRELSLPTCSTEDDLANKFSDLFPDKGTTIRNNISANTNDNNDNTVMAADIAFEGQSLSKFTPTTPEEVRQIIMKAPSKSCELDPLPTHLLKVCLEPLLPLITAIINRSLVESAVPQYF